MTLALKTQYVDHGLGQLQCIYFILWIVPIQSILKLKTWIFGLGPYFKVCLMSGFKKNKFTMIAAY